MTVYTLFGFSKGFLLGLYFLNIPPALSFLKELYSASYTTISLLISAMLWTHALIQVPAGVLTDRWGLRDALTAALLLMGLSQIIAAAWPNIQLAVAGRVVVGLGTAFSFVAVMKLLAVYAPQGRVGTYQAFYAGSFSFGSIAAFLVIPWLAALNWRWIYLAPALVCFSLLCLFLPLELRETSPVGPPAADRFKPLRMPAGWILGLYHTMSHGSILTLGSWVPTLLSEVFPDAGNIRFAWGGALVMLVGGMGRLAGGFVLLRWRALPIANGALLLQTIMLAGIFLAATPGQALCFAVATTLFAAISYGAIFQIASDQVPSTSLGLFFGLINFLANAGAISFTIAFGWIKDATGTLTGGFGLMACFGLITLGCGVYLFGFSRTRTPNGKHRI